MKEKPSAPFLARPGYRRRRLIEKLRLLPILGLTLFFLPLLWATGRSGTALTSSGWLYVFITWFVLIWLAAWGTRALDRSDTDEEDRGTDLK